VIVSADNESSSIGNALTHILGARSHSVEQVTLSNCQSLLDSFPPTVTKTLGCG